MLSERQNLIENLPGKGSLLQTEVGNYSSILTTLTNEAIQYKKTDIYTPIDIFGQRVHEIQVEKIEITQNMKNKEQLNEERNNKKYKEEDENKIE